ncbi:MAG TPA: ATP-binding cassette domain-containing protein [Pseudomonadales bacterium]
MLQAIDVSFARGGSPLFSRLSCTIHAGQKVALVGRNGVGKSTLFQLFLGELHPDAGEIRVPAHWQMAHMAQQVDASDRPLLEYVQDGHERLRAVEQRIRVLEQRIRSAEEQGDEASDAALELARLHGVYADIGGYEAEARAAEIANGLGFTSADFGKPFNAFSGGWRIRASLARALMCPADLLLLDEPTNHLDLDTTLWLENWLQRFRGTLILIAHDREFLDAVADHVLHLHDGVADGYRGNYSSFERQRAEALMLQQAVFEKQQAEIRHIQSFIDRFRAKASKARQVQSRIKALERMQSVAPVYAESPYRFAFTDPEKVSNPLLVLDDVAIGYGDRPVLSGIRRSILPGARIGVLGANGAGKSTLLKCLVGALPPLAGSVVRGQHSRIGYFAQHQLESLRAERPALAQLLDAHPQQREQWARDYLGRWGFSGAQVDRPVGTYSGGEKARLALALIALTRPALLVLDEPTNHLDLDMREALGLALQDYAGALLLVSHDRSLLKRTVDELWLVENGRVTTYADDLDSYTLTRRADSGRSAPRHERREERRAAAEQRQRQKPLRDRIRACEREMEKLEKRLTAVESRLADPDVYHSLPAAELDALLAEAGRLRRALGEAEEAWLEASAELESLMGSAEGG